MSEMIKGTIISIQLQIDMYLSFVSFVDMFLKFEIKDSRSCNKIKSCVPHVHSPFLEIQIPSSEFFTQHLTPHAKS